jgi:MFS family permease
MQGSFWLLLGSALLLGFGNSSNQLTRYVSADMAPAARRAKAIGLVVWAATIGAIVGPNIVPLAASISESAGLPKLAGPFLIPVVFAGLASLLLFLRLRPDPYALAEDHARFDDEDTARGRPMREIVRRPVVLVAITAMIVGQVVMVVVMTMTPLHMTEHGHGLAAVGLVLSAHTAGMFAFSPISGWMAQRLGNVTTILMGVGVLALSSMMAALAPPDGGTVLFAAMFLLGFGWNLGFVAGSALLTTGVTAGERTRTEGFTDTLVWGSSAVASLSSGLILAALGFSALGIIAMFILVLPIWAVLSNRGSIPMLSRSSA